MKKIIYLLILFLFSPVMVNAANYKITNQYIKAQILNNGDLKVSELIVMDGSFNGYEKSLSFINSELQYSSDNYANNAIYNASGIDLIDIKGKYVNKVSFDTFNDSDFNTFSLVSSASNGDRAKYTMSSSYNGYTYRLYYKSNNQKVAFLVEYIIKNVVVLHNDVAELYWNFISPNYYDDINDIQIQVLLPGVDNSDNFRVWAHGNLSGEVNKLNNNEGVKAEIGSMASEDVLDIRLTFNKNLISEYSQTKKNNDSVLNKIIEVETERAEVANNLRKQLLLKYNIAMYGSIIYVLSIIVLSIIIYYKYGKSPKSSYYSKYNREFIDDYNVEVIDYLMNRKITPNAMSASIMNLIYKKNISASEIPNTKKKKDYTFVLENMDNINESEKILIEFLFDKVGKKKENGEGKKYFTTVDLKSYASGTKTCNTFISSYTSWKNNVKKCGSEEKFFEKSGVPIIISSIMLIIGVLLFIFATSNGVDFFLVYLIPIFCIAFMFYGILIDKKTIKGVEHYTKWKAFKNFLNDFGAFELKELPEIVLWERYLVYATIFGLAKKVQRDMNVRISELETSGISYDYYPDYFYINLGDTINTSVNNAISSAYSRQAANYANSHSSSSSGGGFGGGFSSGGGFGGGGSSGHGF